MTFKAIIIHEDPKNTIFPWVSSLRDDWDTQRVARSVADTWALLNSPDGLSPESKVVMVSDRLWHSTPSELAVLIATFAPHALVLLLQEDREIEQAIRAKVAQEAQARQTPLAQFYTVDTSSPSLQEDINGFINSYLSSVDPTPAPEPTPTPVAQPETQQPLVVSEQAVPQTQQRVVRTEPINKHDYTEAELQELNNSTGTPAMVVASTSTKGGSGKTTTSLSLAVTFAQASKLASEQGKSPIPPLKILVIDGDIGDSQLGFAIDMSSPSILNLWLEVNKLATEKGITTPPLDVIQRNIINFDKYGVDFLLGPKRGVHASFVNPEFFSSLLRRLRLQYDIIIIDTSINYLDPLLNEVIYPESNVVLYNMDLSKGALFGLPRWLNEVVFNPQQPERGGIPQSNIGIVINRVLHNVGIDLDLIRKAAKGTPILAAIPADQGAAQKYSNRVQIDVLVRTHEFIAPEYFKLAQKLWKIWQNTPLISPYEDYLVSDDKRRDDIFREKYGEDPYDKTAINIGDESGKSRK